MQQQHLRCWRWNISALGFNTMPADALAPEVARASTGMVLPVLVRQHVGLLHCEFSLLPLNKIQYLIQNASLMVFKTIQYVKSEHCMQLYMYYKTYILQNCPKAFKIISQYRNINILFSDLSHAAINFF